MTREALLCAALVALAFLGSVEAQLGCANIRCPDVSDCQTVGAVATCVCPPDRFSRLLNGKCTAAPLRRWGWLDGHTAARAAVGVGPLVWDAALAAQAKTWADTLASTRACAANRNPPPFTGQNVAAHFGNDSFTNVDAVLGWVRQGVRWRYSAYGARDRTGCITGRWRDCYFYTQVIWNATTSVGCARTKCPEVFGKVFVCNYSPAGNVFGQVPFSRTPSRSSA